MELQERAKGKPKATFSEERIRMMYDVLYRIVERYGELQGRDATHHEFSCVIIDAENLLAELHRKCIKRVFDTQAECEESIRQNDVGIPLKAYKCDECGSWHKTKHLTPVPTIQE